MSRVQSLIWKLTTAAVLAAGLLFNLSGYPLLDPDEGRNAEVAREMAESNDYVVPQLNGLPYIDKPVLYFGVGAIMMELLGPTVLAARLPSLLFTLGTLTLMLWFGRRLYGPAGGWIAAVATAATPLTLAFSRTVIFDSALTFFVVLSLFAFLQSIELSEVEPARDDDQDSYGWWIVGAWGAIALGILTKGPVAIALPLLVVIPYAIWRKRFRAILDPVALLLLVALVLPWVVAMSREVPGFLEHSLVTETYRRLTTDELQRSGPVWYFFPILLAGALPWSLIAIGGWRPRWARDDDGRVDRRVVFLALWIVLPLLLFTASQSKRPQYLLPIIPAVGLLVAYLWTRPTSAVPGARVGAIALLWSGAVVLFSPLIVPALLDVHPTILAAIPRTAIVLGGVTVAAGVGAWFARDRSLLLLLFSLPMATIPFASTTLMQGIGRDRSSEAMAIAIQRVMSSSTEIVGIEAYPLSLPFYLERGILLATDDGSELTSNYLVRSFDRWTRNPGTPFRELDWWFDAMVRCERPRIFLIRADDDRVRSVLSARLALLFEGRKVAAYGPCSVTGLAADTRER